MNYLCVCFNSELLRYQDIHAFAKTDTENAELASKDAQTAAFSASTQKPVHQESLRSFSGETDTENPNENPPALESVFISHPSPYFIRGSGRSGIINEGRRGTRDIKNFGLETSGGIYGNT